MTFGGQNKNASLVGARGNSKISTDEVSPRMTSRFPEFTVLLFHEFKEGNICEGNHAWNGSGDEWVR